MNKKAALTVIPLMVFVCGCSTLPAVKYYRIQTNQEGKITTQIPDEKDLIGTFVLAKSEIRINPNESADGSANTATKKDEAPAANKQQEKAPKQAAGNAKKANGKAMPKSAQMPEAASEPVQNHTADETGGGANDGTNDKLFEPTNLGITSVPVESDIRFAVGRADAPGLRTNVNISKIDNTDLIKEVGTEVVDSRADYIQKIGGIAVALVGLGIFDTDKSKPKQYLFPATIDVQQTLEKSGIQLNAGQAKDIEFVSPPTDSRSVNLLKQHIFVAFGALPAGSKPINELPSDAKVSFVPRSACRSATIYVLVADGIPLTKTVKVADDRYYQTDAMPVKGKVTMHSECGASIVSSTDNGVKSDLDIAEALTAQGKAIKDAIAASKKESK